MALFKIFDKEAAHVILEIKLTFFSSTVTEKSLVNPRVLYNSGPSFWTQRWGR